VKKIIVLGLGSGTLEQMPIGIYRTIKQAKQLYFRTACHPVVDELAAEGIHYNSFDEVYEAHQQFAQVYEDICQRLLTLAEKETVVYGVPGHPLVAEKTVQLLLEQGPQQGIDIQVIGGQSFLDAVFTALKIDPVEGFSLLDGSQLTGGAIHPGGHILICQVYDSFTASDVKLTLMELYPDEYPVTVVTAAGIPGEERIETIPLYELDRLTGYSNLTTVYVPPTEENVVLNKQFWRLKEIVEILRSPEGCPWDREQTHQSIRKNLIEETCEVLETIDEDDPEAMCEELGDLLMQILLHSQMAEEEGFFTVYDVIATLNEKLLRRHPHVFGEMGANDAEEALQNWQAIKAEEKKAKGIELTSLLDGLPRDLTALLTALKLQKKAATVGFDWDDIELVKAKVLEEWHEFNQATTEQDKKEEFGDILFALVNLARFADIDPEEALSLSNNKFKRRFAYIEGKFQQAGKNLDKATLEEMEEIYQEGKRKEKGE
jgi:tetrapyrrole methylase family protein/MazG family protein